MFRKGSARNRPSALSAKRSSPVASPVAGIVASAALRPSAPAVVGSSRATSGGRLSWRKAGPTVRTAEGSGRRCAGAEARPTIRQIRRFIITAPELPRFPHFHRFHALPTSKYRDTLLIVERTRQATD